MPTGRLRLKRYFQPAVAYLARGKFVGRLCELPEAVASPLADRQFPKLITVAWLTLGITSIALAFIAAMVLRSERESTVVLHHLNLMVLIMRNSIRSQSYFSPTWLSILAKRSSSQRT
jgi:hypothetical protein